MSNWPAWLPLRKDLSQMSVYGAPQVAADAQLNTNENPYAPSKELVAAIGAAVTKVSANLNRYPDREASTLRGKLASFINELSGTKFSETNIWAANGSNEIIQSLYLAFGSGKAIGFTPSYSMHPLIAQVTAVTWEAGKRKADFTIDMPSALAQIQKGTSLVFLTTPNNPTGTALSIDDLKSFAAATAKVGALLVVDEAYAEFSPLQSAVTLIEEFPHLVVCRTMSKAFAMAGARLGYLVANPSVIEAMHLVRLPYHLSSITQAVAEVALDFRKELLGTVAELKAGREWLSSELVKLGLTVVPSAANFILFTGFTITPAALWQKILDRGALIRDVGLPQHLRVTVGTQEENQIFIDALRAALAE